MALVMKMDTEKFKEALTGEGQQEMLTNLIKAGVSLEVGFYSVILRKGDQHVSTDLPVSTTSMLKGFKSDTVKTAVEGKMAALFEHALESLLGGVLTTEAPKKAKPKAPKAFNEELSEPAPWPTPDPEPKPKIPDGPVKLRFAVAIGQPVTGTSLSSIYRVVAISERLKLAARLHGTNISLRCEGEPNSYEKGRLAALGFTKSDSGHWSVHMESSGIPPARILGAVLMDLDLGFTQQAKTLKEAQL